MKAFKVYPFAIGSGYGTQVLLAEGSYFRVKTATGDVGVSFDDNTNLGPINVGQGFKVHGGYKRLTLSDMSGAANSGTLIVAGDDFVDQQLSGVVQVIDGEKARSLAGGAFTSAPSVQAAAGQYAYCQLWNPAGSGKNLFMQQASFSSAQAGSLYVQYRNAALTTDNSATVLANKKAGGTAGAGQARVDSLVAGAAAAFWSGYLVAGSVTTWLPKGGLVIPPGQGFTAIMQVAASSLYMNVEWFEESV